MSTDASKLEPQAALTTPDEPVVENDLLDQIIKNSQAKILSTIGVDPDATNEEKTGQIDLVAQLVEEVLQGTLKVSGDTEVMLNARIAEIDKLLTDQLNAILHEPDFQKLEASWRGLHYLVDKTETSTELKIRVMHATKKELVKDFDSAVEFDQSSLFKKVYRDEYSVFGGRPYGALIGDYEFGKHPQDVELLKKISQVAAMAHAPFLSAASSKLFGLESFNDMPEPRDLAKIFEMADYAKWRAFRDSDDSRYVGLCLPHILLRLPYGPETKPVEAFSFDEGVNGRDASKYLWGNAAYAMGVRLTDAFANYGCCVSIRGVENGGLVQDLPLHTFRNVRGELENRCPTEVIIDDRREKELADLGFIALTHCKDTDYAAFFSAQSCQKPAKYMDDGATANARLSTQLQYILMISRFAHYLKAIARDKIGAFMSRGECEKWLNEWIMQYVLEDDYASQEYKSKQPLRAAKITVEEIKAKPGCYQAVAHLRPHFMLDELTMSLRLVSELPAALGKS